MSPHGYVLVWVNDCNDAASDPKKSAWLSESTSRINKLRLAGGELRPEFGQEGGGLALSADCVLQTEFVG